MQTTIAGPSTDTPTVPRVFAYLERGQDGSPVLKIDDAHGKLLKVQGVTRRDLMELAQQSLEMLGERDPCGCKRCQARRHQV